MAREDRTASRRSSRARVGMIGLGIMGSALSANLMAAGFEVIGYDPKPACRARHRRQGGTVAASVGEVAAAAGILVTSLPSTEALDAIAGEILAVGRPRQIVVETSTFPIAAKEKVRRRLAKAGISLLDCPLSGTGAQARVKDLVVYASGPSTDIRRCARVFAGFARGHYDLGKFGNGSKMKFAANLLVAIHNVSTAEAIVLARKSGLDPALAVKVLADGAGASRMLQVRGPMMVRRNYRDATMRVEIWQKDMAIITAYLRELGSPAPLFMASRGVYAEAMKRGLAKSDTAAVCEVLESRAKKRPEKRPGKRPRRAG
ncbi:MAG: NAD(P)-dependent oxidoreductase [Betaproteobacteria bacterium]